MRGGPGESIGVPRAPRVLRTEGAEADTREWRSRHAEQLLRLPAPGQR